VTQKGGSLPVLARVFISETPRKYYNEFNKTAVPDAEGVPERYHLAAWQQIINLNLQLVETGGLVRQSTLDGGGGI